MGLFKEFKDFAMRGNVVDLAVAVIIAGAFGKIVSSFVKDVIMPPIGVAMGGVDFNDLKYILQEAVGETAAVTINYGTFIMTLVDFIIIAFAIFMVVKAITASQKKEEEVPAGPTTEEKLLTEIRDALSK